MYTHKNESSLINFQRSFCLTKKTVSHPAILKLLSLCSSGEVEVALHGYFHHQVTVPAYHVAQEFEFLNVQRCAYRLHNGLALLANHGFDVVGFKPPAWGVGHRSGFALLRTLENGCYPFRYVCLSSPTNGLNLVKKTMSHIWPSFWKQYINIPQNISVEWPRLIWRSVIDKIIDRGGVINVQTHFVAGENVEADVLNPRVIETMGEIAQYIRDAKVSAWHATHAKIAEHLRVCKDEV